MAAVTKERRFLSVEGKLE